MYFAAAFLASLLVSATASWSPQDGKSVLRRQNHVALAKVRAAAPDPVLQPLQASAVKVNRLLKKRCAAQSPASQASPSAPPQPTNGAVPNNVASPPISSSSSSQSFSSQSSLSNPPAPSPAPLAGQSGDLFSGTQLGGDGTYYGTGVGACGITNNDSQMIAAVSMILFDSYPGYNLNNPNPNTNPVCKKQVLAEYQGKQVTVTITDRCVGCAATSLDFSPAAFSKLADLSVGRIHNIRWTWL